MTAPLVQKLTLAVDATTGSTESRMDAVATSVREAGQAAERSAGQVAAAAERVAAAQLKRDDAAGRVAVAERRLQEVQERSNADSSQVLAAQERLETARRQLAVSTRQLEAAEEDNVRTQRDAAESTERLATEQERAGQSSDRFGGQLDDLAGSVKALGAFSLGAFVTDSVRGFSEGARGAQTLATSMNATVEQGGRLFQLFSNLGLEADDLLEIQAEFANQVGDSGDALAEFGAKIVKNDDDTVNWALTLQDALVNLQKIPDATQRNATGFRLFGEEGYKQLSRLLVSGVSVEEALRRIGTPFDEEDVARAQEFDAALADLKGTSTGVSTELGANLLPIITGLFEGVGAVVDVVEQVPGPMGAAAAAAVLFGIAQRSAAVEGSALNTALANSRERVAGFRSAVGDATANAGRLGGAMGVARVAGGGLLSALGGPLGVAVLGLGVGFTVLNNLVGSNSQKSRDAAAANDALAQALKESNGVVTSSVREQAAASAQQAGIIETARRAGVAQGDVTDALLGNEAAYRRVSAALEAYRTENSRENNLGTTQLNAQGEAAADAQSNLDDLRGTVEGNATAQGELAEELGQTTDKQALATAATEALTAAIESGNVPTAELTRLAHDAAVAQDSAAAASDRAEAAVDAYRATTTGASEAVLGLITAQYGAENASFQFLNAVDAAKTATDDATTSVDEQRQAQVNVTTAAIAAAGAVADAAVANARAAGQVVDDLAEAQIRADAVLGDLRASLNTPGLTEGARLEIQGVIDRLQEARDRGDIEAVLTLTGAQQVEGELEDTTEDRDTTVRIESRNGPAVIRYIEGDVAKDRQALIRVESRNGPVVDSYLDGLTRERLAIIRVETRNGPNVDSYLDGLARTRTAVINVQRRETGGGGGGGVPRAAGLYGASGDVIVQQLVVQPQVDSGGRLSAAQLELSGRQVIGAIRSYERKNGTGWRQDGRS